MSGKSVTARKESRIFLALLAMSAAAPALAADLRAPFDFETTKVLPRGVRNPRFKNLVMTVDEKFGGSGGAEPLGYKLNKVVSWQDVLNKYKSDPAKQAQVEGYLKSLGFSSSDAAGGTRGVVNTYANVKVPVMAMGLNERWTLAVAVPVISVDVNADTGFARTKQGDDFIADYQNKDPLGAEKAEQDLNDAINSKLAGMGYERIQSRNFSGVGDVKVISKHHLTPSGLFGDGRDALTAKCEATLPTGTPPNVDRLVDVPMGDGQTDVGAMLIYDRYLEHTRSWRANFYAGYTAQLPDHLERRIPVSEEETLTSDKELVARDLGDVINTGAALQYEFPFGLNLGAIYGLQYLGKTRFEGSKFSPYRYSVLEKNTQQLLHSATLGVGFNSVEMYKSKRFAAPLQVNLSYCKPLAGFNVAKNDFMAFELVLFF